VAGICIVIGVVLLLFGAAAFLFGVTGASGGSAAGATIFIIQTIAIMISSLPFFAAARIILLLADIAHETRESRKVLLAMNEDIRKG
jgi:hypothetical protein